MSGEKHLHYHPAGQPAGSVRSNGLPGKPYVWRDPGRQAEVRAMLEQIRSDPDAGWLLADSFDEPYEPEPPYTKRQTRRRERMAAVASLRLNDTFDAYAPEGLTIAEAAERLGVSGRTIQRYKRDLREMAGAS